MSNSTAQKVVLAFAIAGIFFALYPAKGATGADKYRKVWGVTLLSAVGAIMADFVPSLVGPFFGLIGLAWATGHMPLISQAKKQATSTATGGKAS